MSDSPSSALPQNPDASDAELQVILHEDSLMFLGPESALTRLDESSPQEKLARVAPKVAHNLSRSARTLSQFQENSGRYLKLSKDSAQFLKENKVAAEKIRAGVLRVGDLPGAKGNAGSIVKHLKFEKPHFSPHQRLLSRSPPSSKRALRKHKWTRCSTISKKSPRTSKNSSSNARPK